MIYSVCLVFSFHRNIDIKKKKYRRPYKRSNIHIIFYDIMFVCCILCKYFYNLTVVQHLLNTIQVLSVFIIQRVRDNGTQYTHYTLNISNKLSLFDDYLFHRRIKTKDLFF